MPYQIPRKCFGNFYALVRQRHVPTSHFMNAETKIKIRSAFADSPHIMILVTRMLPGTQVRRARLVNCHLSFLQHDGMLSLGSQAVVTHMESKYNKDVPFCNYKQTVWLCMTLMCWLQNPESRRDDIVAYAASDCIIHNAGNSTTIAIAAAILLIPNDHAEPSWSAASFQLTDSGWSRAEGKHIVVKMAATA
ncbi:hypothetical protein BJV82DRAFT_620988 [Fennellomyces sp. T-0311]|nr:hypothetical protein BJV82DRAFT_620988 [Fennellomyces sp. T-0311]